MSARGSGLPQQALERPKSAYIHFQKWFFSDDNPTKKSLPKLTLTVASKVWKDLSAEDKRRFQDLAVADRARYDRECEVRDAQAQAAHEQRVLERQNQDKVVDTARGNRKRARNAASGDRANQIGRAKKKVAAPVRPKVLSERQQRIHSQLVDQFHKNEKMHRARVKFLLKQGDIFTHFVGTSGKNFAQALGKQFGKLKDDASPGGERGTTSESPKKRRKGRPPGKKNRGKHRGHGDDDDEDGGDSVNEKDIHVFTASPHYIQGTMRDYQIEGLNWMIELHGNGMSGILADEMGLGKTLQSISILGFMQHFQGVNGPHIVVAPKSTLSNWMSELKRFCPTLRAVVLQGTKEERQEIIKTDLDPGSEVSERKFDVLVISYEVAIIEKSSLMKFPWVYLVLDEAHRVKNENSKLSQTLRNFSVQYRLLLTGTPLQNNLHELWALLNFLLPEIFSSSEVFDAWFNLTNSEDREAKETMVRQLHRILKPFMLRRLKKDVAKTLPPKKETLLYVGMSEMQRGVYRKILERDLDAVISVEKGGDKLRLQNIVMQLRKATNHPYLFDGVEDRNLDPLGEHLISNSAKLLLLDKLLPRLRAGGNRVLIFSQMTRLLDILEDYCMVRKHEYCRIDGSTSYDDREDMIERYNAPNSKYFIFLLSTRAGGLGINLATADTVILYDSDWNPQVDLQAQDRAHRIGQTKPVNVYRLVTEDSVEEKIIERAEMKLRLDAVVIQQGRLAEQKTKLSKDEMLAMIRFGAENIFRSKDTTVTDDDIEAILSRGEKKTQALSSKLKKYEKGDLLDLKLEYSGSTTVQQFDGVDYSNGDVKALQNVAMQLMSSISDAKGKRKRSERGYKEQDYYRSLRDAPVKTLKRIRIPDSLKTHPSKFWHFINQPRIHELNDMAIQEYKRWYQEQYEILLPTLQEGQKITDIIEVDDVSQFFTPEEFEERARLMSEGLTNWSFAEYKLFVTACCKHGRHNLKEIARHIPSKLPREVEEYSKRFFEVGPLRVRNWEKWEMQISKADKKLQEKELKMPSVRACVAQYPRGHFIYQFRLRKSQISALRSKEMTLCEDAVLLQLLAELGYGAWGEMAARLQSDNRLMFSYHLKSRTPEDLQRRCHMLMRLVEKDMEGFDKAEQDRQEAIIAEEVGRQVDAKKNMRNDMERHMEAEINRLTMEYSVKEMKKMQGIREKRCVLLDRLMALNNRAVESTRRKCELLKERQAARLQKVKDKFARERAKIEGQMAEERSENEDGEHSPSLGSTSKTKLSLSPEHREVVARIIAGVGAIGLEKLVQQVMAELPEGIASKRQINREVAALGVKEKRDGDTAARWYLRAEGGVVAAPVFVEVDLSGPSGGGGESIGQSEAVVEGGSQPHAVVEGESSPQPGAVVQDGSQSLPQAVVQSESSPGASQSQPVVVEDESPLKPTVSLSGVSQSQPQAVVAGESSPGASQSQPVVVEDESPLKPTVSLLGVSQPQPSVVVEEESEFSNGDGGPSVRVYESSVM